MTDFDNSAGSMRCRVLLPVQRQRHERPHMLPDRFAHRIVVDAEIQTFPEIAHPRPVWKPAAERPQRRRRIEGDERQIAHDADILGHVATERMADDHDKRTGVNLLNLPRVLQRVIRSIRRLTQPDRQVVVNPVFRGQ